MQMKDELDARKKRVLQAIVDDYKIGRAHV